MESLVIGCDILPKSALAGLIIILIVLTILAGYAYYYSSSDSLAPNVKSSESNVASKLSVSAIMLVKNFGWKNVLVGYIMISNIGDEEITIEKIVIKDITITLTDTSTTFKDLEINSNVLPYTLQPRESISIKSFVNIPDLLSGYVGGSPESYDSILGPHVKSATLIIVTSDGNYTARYVQTLAPAVREEIPPANVIQIMDAVFFRTISPGGELMNVTLQYSVKNLGDQRIILVAIRIPEIDFEAPVNVILNPEQVFSDSILVLRNQAYTPAWDAGTEHVIVFVYRVWGETENRTVSQKTVVQ